MKTLIARLEGQLSFGIEHTDTDDSFGFSMIADKIKEEILSGNLTITDISPFNGEIDNQGFNGSEKNRACVDIAFELDSYKNLSSDSGRAQDAIINTLHHGRYAPGHIYRQGGSDYITFMPGKSEASGKSLYDSFRVEVPGVMNFTGLRSERDAVAKCKAILESPHALLRNETMHTDNFQARFHNGEPLGMADMTVLNISSYSGLISGSNSAFFSEGGYEGDLPSMASIEDIRNAFDISENQVMVASIEISKENDGETTISVAYAELYVFEKPSYLGR